MNEFRKGLYWQGHGLVRLCDERYAYNARTGELDVKAVRQECIAQRFYENANASMRSGSWPGDALPPKWPKPWSAMPIRSAIGSKSFARKGQPIYPGIQRQLLGVPLKARRHAQRRLLRGWGSANRRPPGRRFQSITHAQTQTRRRQGHLSGSGAEIRTWDLGIAGFDPATVGGVKPLSGQ